MLRWPPCSINAIPHNSARAGPEKIWVLIKALFRRCTLCTSRKSDEIRAQIFQEMPKTDCAVLPYALRVLPCPAQILLGMPCPLSVREQYYSFNRYIIAILTGFYNHQCGICKMLKKDGGADGEAFITVLGWTRPGSDALCGKRLPTREKRGAHCGSPHDHYSALRSF